jgi:hypothetical protein
MPTVEHVERRIFEVEGFDVRLRYSGPGPTRGRDVRGDRRNLPSYGYRRAARGTDTVAAWVQGRFAKQYPGFAVDVLDVHRRPVHGQTRLESVRATYR